MSVDLAVVGSGAAGLMAAITAKRRSPGLTVTVFDSRPKIGAKILMSGGTRCNVTNRAVKPSDYHGGPSHFLKHVLEAYTPSATIQFFRDIGVELVLEPTGKYFPATNSAKTVLLALTRALESSGAELMTGRRITRIEKKDGGFVLSGDGFQEEARAVILATGGLSHPDTGSDGKGLEIAEVLGHRVTPLRAALTPLMCNDAAWNALSGVSADVRLSFYSKGRKTAETRGAMLCTHFGFSGPAALDISRYWSFAEKADKPEIRASFAPDRDEAAVKSALEKAAAAHPGKTLKNQLSESLGLPDRLVTAVLGKLGLDGSHLLRTLRGRDAGRIAHGFVNCPLPVTGVYGFKKAEVTAGGVDLREVKVQTMESKLVPGLYFAGEILDMDGRIGGFNFQWAWSSGAVAGRAAAESLS